MTLSVFIDNQLKGRNGKFLRLDMFFSLHKTVPGNNIVQESMRLVVNQTNIDQPLKKIFETKIKFDYSAFQYYLNIPKGMGNRKKNQLDIAEEFVTPILKGK